MEQVARQYVESSGGKTRAVVMLDIQRPEMKKAWVGLLVADGSPSSWAQPYALFHDDDLGQQPTGSLILYLSDLVGLAGVPATFCRPTTAELADGVSRFVISS
jgi:hypothetical protein